MIAVTVFSCLCLAIGLAILLQTGLAMLGVYGADFHWYWKYQRRFITTMFIFGPLATILGLIGIWIIYLMEITNG